MGNFEALRFKINVNVGISFSMKMMKMRWSGFILSCTSDQKKRRKRKFSPGIPHETMKRRSSIKYVSWGVIAGMGDAGTEILFVLYELRLY